MTPPVPLPQSPLPHDAENRPGNPVALTVVTVMFFMWGFITSLNDVLIPHLKSVFDLGYSGALLVQFTFFGAYFVMSIPAGKVVAKLGYKTSIIMGLVITGIGALLFFPAARLPSYPLFLIAFFVLATGITVLQVAANPYVSLLGPERTSSSRLNLAQAFNSLGTTLAPRLGGMFILSASVLAAPELAKLPAVQQLAYKVQQAQLVQVPYLILAALLFVLAVVVWLFRLPPLTEATEKADPVKHTLREALSHRHLLLGVIAIFVYVGAEVSLGSFMVNYISEPSIGNMSEQAATTYVSLYWGGAMIGRIFGFVLMLKLNASKLLGVFATIAGLLVLTTMMTTGHVAMWSVVAIGLFNSIMFPTIFTLGIARLGPLTGKASSLLVMAIVGGALIPLLQGVLADHIGIQHAFILPLICYLYIIYYGFHGSRTVTSNA
jgi:FHS family L-fucose permease-like MFS transporter